MSQKQNNQSHNRRKVKAKQGAQSIEGEMSISGPFPSAQEMQGYHSISPELVDRIMTLTENEASQRHQSESRIIEVNYQLAQNHQKDRNTGQWIGAGVATLALLTSCCLGYLGHGTAAGIVGSTTVIGLVTVFVTGQKTKKDK